MAEHYMNPAYGSMMEGAKSADKQSPGKEATNEEHKRAGENKPPHIFIHSHDAGHTVHIHHGDGRHEQHEHEHGDVEGMAQHIHTYLGAGSAPESAGADEQAAVGER